MFENLILVIGQQEYVVDMIIHSKKRRKVAKKKEINYTAKQFIECLSFYQKVFEQSL